MDRIKLLDVYGFPHFKSERNRELKYFLDFISPLPQIKTTCCLTVLPPPKYNLHERLFSKFPNIQFDNTLSVEDLRKREVDTALLFEYPQLLKKFYPYLREKYPNLIIRLHSLKPTEELFDCFDTHFSKSGLPNKIVFRSKYHYENWKSILEVLQIPENVCLVIPPMVKPTETRLHNFYLNVTKLFIDVSDHKLNHMQHLLYYFISLVNSLDGKIILIILDNGFELIDLLQQKLLKQFPNLAKCMYFYHSARDASITTALTFSDVSIIPDTDVISSSNLQLLESLASGNITICEDSHINREILSNFERKQDVIFENKNFDNSLDLLVKHHDDDYSVELVKQQQEYISNNYGSNLLDSWLQII
jgi:hypothetical protein